jgi:hypothetical protein
MIPSDFAHELALSPGMFPCPDYCECGSAHLSSPIHDSEYPQR